MNFSPAVNPNKDEGFSNVLTPSNTPKAWANITTSGTGTNAATVNAGFNVASATVTSATAMTITLATALSGSYAYCAPFVNINTGSGDSFCRASCSAASTISVSCTNPFSTVDLDDTVVTLSFGLFGLQ
jgi:hypothetical protein